MSIPADEVVARLEDAGVRLDRPLSEADLRKVEKRYGFTFAPEHRDLLRAALPSGDTWLSWRHATPARVRARLEAPLDAGVALAARAWPAAWGARPDDAALPTAARARLAAAPLLVPLHGDDYLPAGTGGPVVRVTGSAAGVCAPDLLAWVDLVFEGRPQEVSAAVPVWSDLTAVSPG